jgi:hypothetical protein
LLPARYFVEHWWSWVAVERWPYLAARLHAYERIVAESSDHAERRAAAAEVSRADEVEHLAVRIADAVAVRRIGTSFDIRESVSNVKS